MKFKIRERRKFNYLVLILVTLLQIIMIVHVMQLRARNEALGRLYQTLIDKRCD